MRLIIRHSRIWFTFLDVEPIDTPLGQWSHSPQNDMWEGSQCDSTFTWSSAKVTWNVLELISAQLSSNCVPPPLHRNREKVSRKWRNRYCRICILKVLLPCDFCPAPIPTLEQSSSCFPTLMRIDPPNADASQAFVLISRIITTLATGADTDRKDSQLKECLHSLKKKNSKKISKFYRKLAVRTCWVEIEQIRSHPEPQLWTRHCFLPTIFNQRSCLNCTDLSFDTWIQLQRHSLEVTTRWRLPLANLTFEEHTFRFGWGIDSTRWSRVIVFLICNWDKVL